MKLARQFLLGLALAAFAVFPALASQNSITNPTTGTLSGLTLVQNINGAHDTLASHFSGSSAPTSPITYQSWVNTSVSPKPFNLYDGASWLTIGTMDTSGHNWNPQGNAASFATLSTTGTASLASLTATTATFSGAVAFSTSPTVPTATAGDNSTKAASTAFVQASIGSISGKNRIINGAMTFDQRYIGTQTFLGTGGSSYFPLDRWKYYSSVAGKLNFQLNAGGVTPPAGFPLYEGVTVATSYTPTSTDLFNFYQPIEGYNVADLQWGTANAKPVTLSFWVRSSVTGTHGGVISNGSLNRSYPFTYSIASANTWTYETVTIPGDTTGTWNSTNGQGINVMFSLGAGSTYKGTAGAWAGANYTSATGAVDVVANSGATWYITGVQLEAGSVATGFDFRLYPVELALCQRYYEKSYDLSVAPGATGGNGYLAYWGAATNPTNSTVFKVTKRASPTVTLYSTFDGSAGNIAVNGSSNTAATVQQSGVNGFSFYANSLGTPANLYVHFSAQAEL